MCLKLDVNPNACENCVFYGMCEEGDEKACEGPFNEVGIASTDD